MSLFEWMGESMNPGPVGTVDVGGRERRGRSPAAVLVCLVLSGVLLGLWAYVLVTIDARPFLSILGTLVYLFLGYFVHPAPETSNLGWLGGLIDHPFRYSDDMNRLLLFLVIVLWPGRFVAESLVDAVRLVLGNR